jgi:hypothetical protein
MNGLVSIYWFFALLGSGLFVIQFALSLFGGAIDDLDDSGEMDGKFKFLSKQALTGFLMMFGWVGLTCQKEFLLSGFHTVWIAFAFGCLAMFITALLFHGAKKLQSPGTIFRIEDAVGLEAVIYQRIPKGGVGKVTVSVSQFTHEIDAIALEELDSFTSVRIIKKADEKTVLVAPIQ